MKFKAYNSYKSGLVNWLPKIPKHWDSQALKRAYRVVNGSTPASSEENYWDGDIVWITPEDLGKNDRVKIGESRRRISHEGLVNSGISISPPGSIVISTRAPIGYLAITLMASTTNQGARTLVPRNQTISPEFHYYALMASREVLRSVGKGTTFLELAHGQLSGHMIPMPSPDEQERIARFLNEKTAKIDGLISKKRDLIEKLKEKRSALIARVVTRGLPPDAAKSVGLKPNPEMKDSGIEWLGHVPARWKIKAIKWESPVQRGASPRPIDDPVYFDDDGKFAWVRISDVTSAGMYLNETEQRLSDIGSALSVKMEPGSLFLSIAGTVGKPCIANIRCCIHDGFVYFPSWKGDSRFLFYVFASGEPYKGLGKMGTQLNLNTDTVGSIVIGVPGHDEQKSIADFLDKSTAKINDMLATVEEAISRLDEYREALITAAVTGKIDVRKEA